LPLRGLVLALVVAVLASVPRAAFAQDRRIEAAAKEAIRRARGDFSAADFDSALALLLKASRACGTIRCSAPTRAALLRDAGVMQLRRREKEKAAALFAEAQRVDRKIELPPLYDAPDIRAAWKGTAGESTPVEPAMPQPTGDFTHTPVSEQAALTPVPVYVEYAGSDAVESVAVKYKGPGDADWKRVNLVHSGRGWGGLIPCNDVKVGTLNYYVQGFDSGGSPNALSGDPKHTFHVPIRRAIVGAPPSLPGQSPPSRCNGSPESIAEVPPGSEEPATCVDDSMCNGGACEGGHCVSPSRAEESTTEFARVWVGISGSVDIAFLPATSDACKLTTPGALPYNSQGYYCTNPDGSDYPNRTSGGENGSIPSTSSSNADQASSSTQFGDIRVLATFDYALSANLLAGARAGFVTHSYPGSAAAHTPLHLELRATYLFGNHPLAHVGFAPLAFINGGYGEFDAHEPITMVENGVPGKLTRDAWRVGGPGFIGLGGGFRYGFSQRVGFTAALKGALAFGGHIVFETIAPELGLQYGF
jgi:hypothetical protein